MFEPLEPRMLLSGVPAGFVEVGSYTIDTGSATPVMTADLTPGVKHIAVVSGTFKVGGPSSHIADAEYHQRGPTKAWNDLTTLTGHNTDMGLDDASGRLGHWGPHEADAEYEQEFTPTTSAPLELFYRDIEGEGPNGAGSTWYDDNVGSLGVKLYKEVSLTELGARDAGSVTNTKFSLDATVEKLLLASREGDVIIDINGRFDPQSNLAGAEVLWSAADSTAAVVAAGDFSVGHDMWTPVDLGAASEGGYLVWAGVDINGDDVLQAAEATRQIEVLVIPDYVNSTGDSDDANIGDGNAWTGGFNAIGAPEVTLRSSLAENADLILFDIPDVERTGAHWVINTGSTLTIGESDTVIDGSSQPGWVNTPVIRIDGGGVVTGSGIEVAGGHTGTVVRSLSIANINGDGISVGFLAQGAIIDANEIRSNTGHGVAVSALASDAVVMNNDIRFNDGDGIYIDAARAVVAENIVYSNAETGIKVGMMGVDTIIVGNETRFNAIGVGFKKSVDTLMIGNIVTNNLIGVGIEDSVGTRVGDGTVEGVNLINGNFTGIAITTDGDATVDTFVTGNEVRLNGGNGIVIEKMSMGTKVDTNDISSNTLSGVVVRDGATTTQLFGNGIQNNGGGVLMDNAVDNEIGVAGEAANIISGNSGDGVRISNSGDPEGGEKNNDIENNEIIGNGANGITLLATHNVRIGGDGGVGNLISGNAGDGVLIRSGSSKNAVQQNDILNNKPLFGILSESDGIELASGAKDNEVIFNNIAGNGGQGVLLSIAGTGNKIGKDGMSNNISNNAANGIRVRETDGTNVLDNNVNDNSLVGILLDQGASGNTVVDNTVVSNNQHGIRLAAASDNNTISANTIVGNFSGGVEVRTASSGNTFEANLIQNNGGDGIEFDNAGGNTVGSLGIFAGNTIIDNAGYGIQAFGEQSDGNTLKGNIITGSGLDGVFIGFGADSNTLESNMIASSGRHGIWVYDGDDNIIGTAPLPNRIADSAENGITVSLGTGNRTRFNVFDGNDLLAIDLGNDGVTANDVDDADTGANRLQNTPILSAPSYDSATGELTITYSVDSTVANSAYDLQVDFYRLRGGELQRLGTDTYGTAEATLGVTRTVMSGLTLQAGDQVLALATDSNQNTSEFSPGVLI